MEELNWPMIRQAIRKRLKWHCETHHKSLDDSTQDVTIMVLHYVTNGVECDGKTLIGENAVGIAIHRAVTRVTRKVREIEYDSDYRPELPSFQPRPQKRVKRRFSREELLKVELPKVDRFRQYSETKIVDSPSAIMDEHLCYRVNVD